MSKDFQTAVRFPSDVVRQLDELAEQMTKDTPGVKVTRAAVIRMMVMRSLSEASAEPGRKRRAAKKEK